MSGIRELSKEIKNTMFPFLEQNGFSEFTTRTGWRITDQAIHVVNIQSFSNSLAYGVGCTTHSFGVNLAMRPLGKGVTVDELPQEWECEHRKQLHKGVEQSGLFTPYGDKSGVDRAEVWYVLKDGSNTAEMVADATRQLRVAMKWFEG